MSFYTYLENKYFIGVIKAHTFVNYFHHVDSALFRMVGEPVPSIAIPAFPHFYNLVVFPSPVKESDGSRFFILKKSADVPEYSSKKWLVEFIPDSIYCLLPSAEREQGKVTVYKNRPQFLDQYSYCLEINNKTVALQKIKSETAETTKSAKKENLILNEEPCKKCFVSHFPRPNKMSCKFSLKKRKKSAAKVWPYRLKGGAGDQESSSIIERAIINAKGHNINFHAGVRNLANGNCAFETIIDSINTRKCFKETLDGTPDEWRYLWMTKVENVAYDKWNNGLTKVEWQAGWATLKKSGTYEYELGDLVLPGIAHCTKKDILIFNTSLSAHSPVYVIESSILCGQKADTEVPICLAYDQTHYEALVPDEEVDELMTMTLKNKIIDGNYEKIFDERLKQSCSNASIVKRKKVDEDVSRQRLPNLLLREKVFKIRFPSRKTNDFKSK